MLKESELVLGDAGLSGIPDSNRILIKIRGLLTSLSLLNLEFLEIKFKAASQTDAVRGESWISYLNSLREITV